MKVNQFKKIEEALFSDLLGLVPDANVSRKVNPKDIQQLYLTDFIEDLYADLDAAIKGGAINTSTTANPSVTEPNADNQEPETTDAQQTKPATPHAAVQPTEQSRQDALQRVAQRKQKQKAAQRNARRRQQRTQTKSTPSKPKPTSRGEDLAGVADLGYNEGYHSFLDSLVESYISEQQSESISRWIMRWFEAYMKGIDWTASKPQVEQLAKQIEDTYSKDKAKKAIEQLAALSWDATFKAKGIPKGSEDVYQSQQKSPSSGIPADELKALEKLRTSNAKKYLDVLKTAGVNKRF